jgi:hypothetical protein
MPGFTTVMGSDPSFHQFVRTGFWPSFPAVKGLDYEAVHWHLSSDEIKNIWTYTSTLNICA